MWRYLIICSLKTSFSVGKKGGALMSKILIVESYPHLASLYRQVLSEDGHHIFVASSCREAEDIAHANDIELVIMDENMPNRCEEELIGTLRTIQPKISSIVCPLTELSRKRYRELCDEGFLKTSDYTILQKKIGDLTKKISGSDLEGFQKSQDGFVIA
jgi:response regulator RpfG family c-di-GMP phosphodiesterase